MKFLLQEPSFSPLRPHVDSISAPSAESKPEDLTSPPGASTVTGYEAKSSDFSATPLPLLFRQAELRHPNESDPTGLSASTPGAKLDKGKVDVLRGAIQYFPRTLKAIAHISELGARKYSWKGWEVVPDGIRRYGAALMRHLFHEDPFATDNGPGGLGEEVIHAAQVVWNACARCELILKELEERNVKNNQA